MWFPPTSNSYSLLEYMLERMVSEQAESSHELRISKERHFWKKNLLVNCENHFPSHHQGQWREEESMKFLTGSREIGRSLFGMTLFKCPGLGWAWNQRQKEIAVSLFKYYKNLGEIVDRVPKRKGENEKYFEGKTDRQKKRKVTTTFREFDLCWLR